MASEKDPMTTEKKTLMTIPESAWPRETRIPPKKKARA
jgi:hypothetical protein